MPEPRADLVIQISASQALADTPLEEPAKACSLPSELQRRLEPGEEIILAFRGYMVTTSIVWIADAPFDGGFHAGVRLLAVSILPEDCAYY